MSIVIRINFDGSFDQGFHVTLFWQQTNRLTKAQTVGTLPVNEEILTQYHHWCDCYSRLDLTSRLRPKSGITNISFGDLKTQAIAAREHFIRNFNHWLTAESFRPIRESILQGLEPEAEIQVFIQSSDRDFLKLPWQSWDIFEDFSQLEVGVGLLRAITPLHYHTEKAPKVRILAILGHDIGIDLQTDLKVLKKLPGTALTYLNQPSRAELNQQLWDQHWDVLFFSGHSETQGAQGVIHINPTESLALSDLKHSLKYSINHGLKLAIFNSCDGLGLAWELQDLHIPQSIVMREQVPDRIAHEFLKLFLTSFSQGNSLFEATRLAREKLQGLEDDYPFASGLPTLVSNPATSLPTWKQLRYGNFPQLRRRLIKATLASSLMITGLLSLGRGLGYFQSIELKSFDLLMQQRMAHSAESMDPRLVIISVTDMDLVAMRSQNIPVDKLTIPDQVLAPLLDKLLAMNPSSIGYDFWRETPVSPSESQLKQTLQTSDRIFGVCQSSSGEKGVPPPPELALSQVGYSNVVQDTDTTIRRFLYGMAPSKICQTDISLGLLLAMDFLAQQDIVPSASLPVCFGEVCVPDLQATTGGYALPPDDITGHQTLINFRATPMIAPIFSLQQLLKGKIPRKAIEGKIVLIGNLTSDGKDFHRTPIDPALSGVELHGHMISQILSAALDDRPFLKAWPDFGESLWIFGWGLLGGIMAIAIHHSGSLILASSLIFLGIGLLCYVALLFGLWLVWIPTFLNWLVCMMSIRAYRLQLGEKAS